MLKSRTVSVVGMQHLEPRRMLASLPAGFSDAALATGLERPVSLDVAGDGRVFVTEQRGNIRIISGGGLLPTPFATLDASSGGERGADGLVLDPDFAANGYVYVYYTAKTPFVHNQVVRLTADGDVAAAGSLAVLFDLDRLDPNSLIHNGGGLRFGADGMLYVTTGENGDPSKAQSLSTTLGKVLRINPNGSIPQDNPFAAQTTGNNQAIWALGLRNPFTFDIERTTGRTFINDVGQATWEEIDQATPGANFGWPATEGPTADPRLTAPLFAYHHTQGDPTGCAITGGTFYDPPAGAAHPFPAEYFGDYFFSDGCNPWVWRLDRDTNTAAPFATLDGPAFSLTTGPDGSLYYTAYNAGQVRRISFAQPGAPVILTVPTAQTAVAGQPATFTVQAFGQEPLTYQWHRDGADLPGATSPSLTIDATTPADNDATFSVTVTNALGSVTTTPVALGVITDDPPTATILAPREGVLYTAGRVLHFSGVATDPEDGRLKPAALSWRIDFHHDEHLHPFYPETAGRRRGTVKIPNVGETSSNVWYRIHLTATDSAGVSTTVFRDVHPRTATVTVTSNVDVAQLTLDGQPIITPLTFTGVVGIKRTLEAPATQVIDGITYTFRGWGNRKRRLLEFKTPPKDRTLTAAYT